MKRQPCFRLPITGDQVVRIALAAYYRATGDATAPIGDPDPVSWSDPDSFLVTLTEYFQLRLRCDAAAAGYDVECDPIRYAKWIATPPYRDRQYDEVFSGEEPAGAGRSPADKGHGCPAFALAVGPASEALPGAYITVSADPLFAVSKLQELPVEQNPANNPTSATERGN